MALQKLAKLASKIDSEGIYAKEILKELAQNGSFSKLNSRDELFNAILEISKVSNICATTGFCMWCQFAIIWYVLNSDNETLKAEILPKLQSGEILGGTALSNPMKAFANIEKNRLKAKKTNGGYIINGTLPWVSNIEAGSIFGAIALENDEPIMGVIRCDNSVKLNSHIKYATLEGSATKSVILKDYFLPRSDILSENIYEYLLKITPGFILLQAGIAAGIISSSLEVIESSNKTHGHINAYLPYGVEILNAELNEILKFAKDAAEKIDEISAVEILELRLKASNLTQKATNSAVLFSGTKGYFKNAKAQRLQREGNFVLIVTPSVKHILKELNEINSGRGVISKWRELARKNA